MRRNGFRVVTKAVRRYTDGTSKANLDVELAIDMLTIAPYVDTAVLVSGDGDFVRLVEAVQFKGVRVEVVGLGEMTSTALIEVADTFTDLAELVPLIQLQNHIEPAERVVQGEPAATGITAPADDGGEGSPRTAAHGGAASV